jgi:3',5'-cyclic AMP phosphodiesterase CpdA
MLTAILHLSDIHFDSPRHPLLRRVNPLARAVASTGRAVDHIVVLVSGDVAQSGTEEQYRVASTFFDELTANLKELLENPGVSYVFVPGNHDCDLV